MYFKRIEMHGFKSFAEPVTIEFDKGITCVVGPNGSGKSNISDAIRWVLGEQSPKMLRGGKMEDVIFAGTSSRKSRGMAEVTLVIDNSTGILPIEYSEVAITRRMYRSGESEYEINNSQCRMKDIRNLLMDTGIGVDGYSLIGQGKISDIISNKTDTIKEIFEETAGIVSYRSKKAETERKLNGAKTNMERVTDIILEIEERIGGLKTDSEKAKEYLSLRDRYKQLEINITLKNIEDIEGKNKVVAEDIKSLDKQILDNKIEKDRLDQIEEKANENLTNLEVEIEENNQKLIAQIEDINRIKNEKEVNRERLNAIEQNLVRIDEETKRLNEKLELEVAELEDLLKKKDEIYRKHLDVSKVLDCHVEEFEKLSSQLASKAERVSDVKNEIFRVSNLISSKEAEEKSYDNLKETLEKRRLQVDEEKAMSHEENGGQEEELEKLKKIRDEISDRMERVQDETYEIKEEYSQVRKDSSNCLKELEAVKINLSKLLTRKKTFEELDSNFDGYNYGVKFVMKAGLEGIYGVVGDLIKVPEGYEVAIETALGAALQNIVCQKDQVAKKAINLLKDNKAGRVTFLPVESVKERKLQREDVASSFKGFEGYGVDIVSFDEKFRGVVSSLLGNVIIVSDMDSAIALSKKLTKGQRIVTIEGEIINPSGAVTGGKFKNKSANILERKAEITKLDKEINELTKNEAKLESRKEKLKAMEEDCLAKGSTLDEEYRDLQFEYMTRRNEITVLEKVLKDFEANKKRWQLALENIDKESENANKAVVKIREEIVELKENLEKLTSEADILEGDSSKFNEEVAAINEKITEARIAVNGCEGEKANIDGLVDRLQSSIDNIKADISSKDEEKVNLGEEKVNLQGKGLDGDVFVKEKEALKVSLEQKLHQLNDERTKLRSDVIKIATDKEFLANSGSKVAGQKYELEIKQAKMDTQLDNLKNKLWEEFEISYLQAFDYKEKDFAITSAVKENREIKNRIRELGEVNVGAIKEYEKVSERYEFLCDQRDDIQKSLTELGQIVEDIDKVIRTKFKESFDQIVVHFEDIFTSFFGGGSAKITLDNEENPLDANIEISVQPPGKQLKNINLLSGGEKTMTAIALMFAVLKTKPTPCCILDEVEAALDDHNIHVFANYLRNFEDIQFTLITHQKTTMEHADVMYGVTMPERGISKVFSLKLGDGVPS